MGVIAIGLVLGSLWLRTEASGSSGWALRPENLQVAVERLDLRQSRVR
jgi:hypothetical protein